MYYFPSKVIILPNCKPRHLFAGKIFLSVLSFAVSGVSENPVNAKKVFQESYYPTYRVRPFELELQAALEQIFVKVTFCRA
jgi:hypothetical protein